MKAHPALTEEHEAWRNTVRRFVEREIVPNATQWDEAGEFPRARFSSIRFVPLWTNCERSMVIGPLN